MDDSQEETVCPVITDGFVRTLLPFFSWYVSQLSWAMFGCKLMLVLRHPNSAYKKGVIESWVEGNFLFSCTEILSFQTASGRRRCRNKLKKLLRPFFRETKRSREWLLFRHRFQEKWNRLKETSSDERPPAIPPKVRIQIDIGKMQERRDKEFGNYRADDILDSFPIGSTLEDKVVKRVQSEVDDYPETMRSLLWEVSQDWSLIRHIDIRQDSALWGIFGFDPNDEPDLQRLIDWSLDFAPGQANEDKLMYLAKWFMDRIIVSKFILHPYSEKHFYSLEKSVGDGLTLEDTLADDRAQNFVDDIEIIKGDTPWTQPTDLSQAEGREAIIEALARKGINYNDLTPKEWAEIFERSDLIRKGYEFSSKTGVSIRSFYGKAAHAKEQKWSRIKKKIRELSE